MDDRVSTRMDFIHEMRLSFMGPRLVKCPRHEHDRVMEAHWLEMAQRLGRPPYNESRGFTADRWGRTGRASLSGCEKPYGPLSREHWKYVWLAMKAAWWSGWNEATGATYETTPPSEARRFMAVTGITT